MVNITGGRNNTKLEINEEGKALVKSTSNSIAHDISKDEGEVYSYSTGGFISITTTGTETGVFYLKNDNSLKNLHIHSIRTCGDQIQKIKIYKNSTTGTLISDQVVGGTGNLNFTSKNEPSSTCYKGANGKTVTDGTLSGQHINNTGHSNELMDGALILGKNDSITITFELAVAGDVCVRVIGYYED